VSDGLPKPTSVEVGQWWRESDEPDEKPVRIIALEGASPYNKAGPWAIYTDGAVPQESLLCSGTYLGSGDHPEPSEWMIEQLARVGSRNRRGINEGAALSERDPQYQDDLRSMARSAIEGAFSLAGPSITELVMLETYSILRSLGKW